MDKIWDTETQEVHGGQTWRHCPTFIADFSVTTNAYGPPSSALTAATSALTHMHHYPAADNADALAALSDFMQWPSAKLLLGNGASEFIDLIFRVLPAGPFKPGPYPAAYMEYNRAAKANGRKIVKEGEAAITVVIHPNSPTGDFMTLEEARRFVKETQGVVVFDESFMPFLGANWRTESALELIEEFPERILVLSSWTKLWACPGVRIGSLAASDVWIKRFKKLQVPWSVNVAAQAFTVAACADKKYMQRSWETLPAWKKRTEGLVEQLGWRVNQKSPRWVPWIFVDCGSDEVADKATEVAQLAGCPVRPCASFGTPQFIRIGVRRPEHQDVLFEAWAHAFDVELTGKLSNGHVNGNVNGTKD